VSNEPKKEKKRKERRKSSGDSGPRLAFLFAVFATPSPISSLHLSRRSAIPGVQQN
jgi:hypothetical protein